MPPRQRKARPKSIGGTNTHRRATKAEKAAIAERVKKGTSVTAIAAAKRRTSFKKLVIEGLEKVIAADEALPSSQPALERLKRGYDLGNKPLSREDLHAR